MSQTVGRYAQIATGSNLVENVILMDADFTIDGYTFQVLASGDACQPGAFYNESDGKYYLESTFENMVGTLTSEGLANVDADASATS